MYKKGEINRERIVDSFEGWPAYISHANTYKYRKDLTKKFNSQFPLEETTEILNVKKNENFIKKIERSNFRFSPQKTLFLFKKGLSIKDISKKRNIKESTVWDHFAELIQYNQLSVWKILSKKKISMAMLKINDKNDKLKDIKKRLNHTPITFDEINCVLASLKCKSKKKD